MNKEWSALQKTMQAQLKKENTYQDGLGTLFTLRNQLMQTLIALREELTADDFCAIPFLHANGFHCKTIAYSVWHIFRIEDIVAHTLIRADEQVFFSGQYQARMHAPVITTGNELVGQQIADFSRQLDLTALYAYISEVKESTEQIIGSLPYNALKRSIPKEQKAQLQSLHVVSNDEQAVWLIDYWCGKNIRELINMPFSRHWIMHTEACLRIRNRIYKQGEGKK